MDGGSWHAAARRSAQALGIDPRYLRRMRWLHKAAVLHRDHAPLRHNLRYVLLDPETDNFTYDLGNEPELAAWVAAVTGCEPALASRYVGEPRADAVLAARLRAATSGRWLWTRRDPRFGKRLGWYALARVLEPGLIIETGVHDGLGSMILLRALERNADHGTPGRLVSFDVNPKAGWLVGAHPMWELRIQSSRDGLPEVLAQPAKPDMFVYDGAHSRQAELWELEAVQRRLSTGGVLLSDDAHNGAMAAVCERHGLAYREVAERPLRHFYPGALLAAGRREPGRASDGAR
ncbi:MAG: class I SAM-dependent methyltransferase [Solirubrobacteraceae bacterium]